MACAPLCIGLLCWLVARARREAARSRAFLQFVLNHIKDGIVILDRNRRIILRNKIAEQLTALPTNDNSYQPVQDQHEVFTADGAVVPPSEWPSSRALRGDFVHDEFLLYRNKITGETGAREMNTAPVPFIPGAAIISYRDDTPRQLIDEARIRLADVVEHSEDAIYSMDTKGIILTWNKGAEKVFGYTAAEIIGQPVSRIQPPERQVKDEANLQRILDDERIEAFDTTRLTKDGRLIQVSLSISPVHDSAGKVIGASKIARDITTTRNLERQLRQSQKMEAIGQLTGGIAHDFNNLLAIILGNLELLESDIRKPVTTIEEGARKIAATLRRTETAERAARRAADLTRRLLAFSARDENLKPQSTSLEHSIRNMLEMATRGLGPEIKIITDLEPNLPPILVDPSGLENALLNLVVNARDAMPKGGILRITTKTVDLEERVATAKSHALKAGQYACVTISDNGIGMSRETLEHVFEPFFTTKDRAHGTGLGLAMVYGFLKQSNGAASIYSEPAYGTTVSLYLPFATLTAQPMSQLTQPQPTTTSATILLVDDEPDILEVASVYLKHVGYTPLRAKDGAEALSIVQENPDLDLVVTDIIMPGGMNGVELVQRIRELRPTIRCVYTSGFPADALAHKRLELSDCALLRKPYRLAELGAIIQSALKP